MDKNRDYWWVLISTVLWLHLVVNVSLSALSLYNGEAQPPVNSLLYLVGATAAWRWSKPGAVVTVPPGGCVIVRNSEEVGA